MVAENRLFHRCWVESGGTVKCNRGAHGDPMPRRVRERGDGRVQRNVGTGCCDGLVKLALDLDVTPDQLNVVCDHL